MPEKYTRPCPNITSPHCAWAVAFSVHAPSATPQDSVLCSNTSTCPWPAAEEEALNNVFVTLAYSVGLPGTTLQESCGHPPPRAPVEEVPFAMAAAAAAAADAAADAVFWKQLIGKRRTPARAKKKTCNGGRSMGGRREGGGRWRRHGRAAVTFHNREQ